MQFTPPPKIGTEFNPALTGFPHPYGCYTGEIVTDTIGRWYVIKGDICTFKVRDYPELRYIRNDVPHDERAVYDFAGDLVFAISTWTPPLEREIKNA